MASITRERSTIEQAIKMVRHTEFPAECVVLNAGNVARHLHRSGGKDVYPEEFAVNVKINVGANMTLASKTLMEEVSEQLRKSCIDQKDRLMTWRPWVATQVGDVWICTAHMSVISKERLTQ